MSSANSSLIQEDPGIVKERCWRRKSESVKGVNPAHYSHVNSKQKLQTKKKNILSSKHINILNKCIHTKNTYDRSKNLAKYDNCETLKKNHSRKAENPFCTDLLKKGRAKLNIKIILQFDSVEHIINHRKDWDRSFLTQSTLILLQEQTRLYTELLHVHITTEYK